MNGRLRSWNSVWRRAFSLRSSPIPRLARKAAGAGDSPSSHFVSPSRKSGRSPGIHRPGLLLVRSRMSFPNSTVATCLGLLLASSTAAASDYCTKEQYERDSAFIESAISASTLARGPRSMRDSILIHEGMWFDMNYLAQITFLQRFECAASGGSGKHFLSLDVRSPSTGKLLATWTLGELKPAQ